MKETQVETQAPLGMKVWRPMMEAKFPIPKDRALVVVEPVAPAAIPSITDRLTSDLLAMENDDYVATREKIKAAKAEITAAKAAGLVTRKEAAGMRTQLKSLDYHLKRESSRDFLDIVTGVDVSGNESFVVTAQKARKVQKVMEKAGGLPVDIYEVANHAKTSVDAMPSANTHKPADQITHADVVNDWANVMAAKVIAAAPERSLTGKNGEKGRKTLTYEAREQARTLAEDMLIRTGGNYALFNETLKATYQKAKELYAPKSSELQAVRQMVASMRGRANYAKALDSYEAITGEKMSNNVSASLLFKELAQEKAKLDPKDLEARLRGVHFKYERAVARETVKLDLENTLLLQDTQIGQLPRDAALRDVGSMLGQEAIAAANLKAVEQSIQAGLDAASVVDEAEVIVNSPSLVAQEQAALLTADVGRRLNLPPRIMDKVRYALVALMFVGIWSVYRGDLDLDGIIASISGAFQNETTQVALEKPTAIPPLPLTTATAPRPVESDTVAVNLHDGVDRTIFKFTKDQDTSVKPAVQPVETKRSPYPMSADAQKKLDRARELDRLAQEGRLTIEIPGLQNKSNDQGGDSGFKANAKTVKANKGGILPTDNDATKDNLAFFDLSNISGKYGDFAVYVHNLLTIQTPGSKYETWLSLSLQDLKVGDTVYANGVKYVVIETSEYDPNTKLDTVLQSTNQYAGDRLVYIGCKDAPNAWTSNLNESRLVRIAVPASSIPQDLAMAMR